MTRQALIDAIRVATGEVHSRKLIAEVVDQAMGCVSRSLAEDGRFAWPGFGSFKVRTRSARPGRNPRTGAPLVIPAGHSITFRPAAALKARLEAGISPAEPTTGSSEA